MTKEDFILNKLKAGEPVYIESLPLLIEFSSVFFPERRKVDRYGFKFTSELEKTEKDFQKVLSSLRKQGKIKKKALGVYGAKTDFILGRNWIWAWMLNEVK